MGIEYKDTVRAIAHLISEGSTISADKILIKLGTGSKPVVLKHLKRWRKEEEPLLTSSSLEDISLPSVIAIAINNVLKNKTTDIESTYSDRLANIIGYNTNTDTINLLCHYFECGLCELCEYIDDPKEKAE
jgi:putative transcriptional regulator